MSSTVQTSGLPSHAADLGMSPLQVAFLRFAGFGLGGLALGGIAALNEGGVVGILVVVFMLPWGILMMYLGIRLLMLLATGGGLHYRRARTAVREGRLGISYYVKGNDHIVVVDEPGRLLCINGDVISFDQVKNLSTQSDGRQHRLAFALNTGASPVRNIDLLTADALHVAFERVGNSLGMK